MRYLFAGLLSLLILWAGYWVVGQRLLESRIAQALATEIPAAITLSHDGFDIAGFPSRFDLTLQHPKIRGSPGI
jgi:Uncharacterized protein conserved in bacteria (DUF2125)